MHLGASMQRSSPFSRLLALIDYSVTDSNDLNKDRVRHGPGSVLATTPVKPMPVVITCNLSHFPLNDAVKHDFRLFE